jgi:hypothetical protein
MRRWIAVAAGSASIAATLALGITPASAAAKYVCTKKADGHTATVRLRNNRAEDAHEAHGWTCTGDTH